MSTVRWPYSPAAQKRASRRPVTQDDLVIYEAIIGKLAKMRRAANGEDPEPHQSARLYSVAEQAWSADLARVTDKLREICEAGLAGGIRTPHLVDWIRQMSNEAFNRLEEAQARLAAARNQGLRRRVWARPVNLRIARDAAPGPCRSADASDNVAA